MAIGESFNSLAFSTDIKIKAAPPSLIVDAFAAVTVPSFEKAALKEGITTLIPYLGAVKAWGQTKGLLETIDDFIVNSGLSREINLEELTKNKEI